MPTIRLDNGGVKIDGTTITAANTNVLTVGTIPPARLDQSGASSGQTLAWNGTAWAPAAAGGGGLSLTTYQANLGSVASNGGTFDITGLSGLTPGANVLIQHLAVAATGKGDLRDEIEMDAVIASGYVLNSSTIRVYWRSTGPVAGYVALGYAVST
jgi:hypothetical protein